MPNLPHYRDRLYDYAISIELMAVGAKDERHAMLDDAQYDSIHPSHIGFTDAQYNSLSRLLDDLLTRYPAIERSRDHIIGYEAYALERKTDLGSLFASQGWVFNMNGSCSCRYGHSPGFRKGRHQQKKTNKLLFADRI